MSDDNVEVDKDHPLQAIDTPVPDPDFVDTESWEAMRDAWNEENPEEAADG